MSPGAPAEPRVRSYVAVVDGAIIVTCRAADAAIALDEIADVCGFAGRVVSVDARDGVWTGRTGDGHRLSVALDDSPEGAALRRCIAIASPSTPAEREANDERAALQRRIATAIRWVAAAPRDAVAEVLLGEDVVAMASRPFRNTGSDEDLAVYAARHMLAALAACAKYPAILDAVNQVATVHALENEQEKPTEGG